jgi:hypothetical protein
MADYEHSTTAATLDTLPDPEGVTVTGFPVAVEGVSSRGSFFLGLGAPDGERARAALTAAVRQARA